MRTEILRSWTGSRVPKRRFQPTLNPVESRLLLSTFTVTTTADSGAGSLRQAIYMADNAGGTNTIDFDIPGSGPQVITLQSELPPITSPTIIDGYTQPGSSPNTSTTADNAVPLIVIDGSQITNIAQSLGLQLQADGSSVQGLVIQNFGGIGVVVSGANDVVQGDFIGTDPTAMFAQANGLGIAVIGSSDMIGGTAPAARDVVSGNEIGVAIASLSIGGPSLLTAEAGSTVQGDLIGTNATGTGNLGNSVIGVALAGSGNIVGGTSPGQANTIAFNGEVGSVLNIGVGVVVIGLSSSASSPISVQSTGNLISGNSIHDNHNMGIGLLDIPTSSVLPFLTTTTASIPSAVANFLSTVDLGVVPNAQTPSGTGPNNLQNFPVIASAVTAGRRHDRPGHAPEHAQHRLPGAGLLRPHPRRVGLRRRPGLPGPDIGHNRRQWPRHIRTHLLNRGTRRPGHRRHRHRPQRQHIRVLQGRHRDIHGHNGSTSRFSRSSASPTASTRPRSCSPSDRP